VQKKETAHLFLRAKKLPTPLRKLDRGGRGGEVWDRKRNSSNSLGILKKEGFANGGNVRNDEKGSPLRREEEKVVKERGVGW